MPFEVAESWALCETLKSLEASSSWSEFSSLHVPVVPPLSPLSFPLSLVVVVVVGLGVVVWLPLFGLVPPLLLLVPCVVGECSRNGTMNAPIPAMMRAAAPSLRLLGIGIIMLCSFSPDVFGRPSLSTVYYST